jgi:hypothetical protein
MRSLLFTTIIALISFSAAPYARCANVVLNGSLEDLNSAFVNVSGNYDTLAAGSTAIADWTVSAGTTNNIVWAKSPTSDAHNASDGIYFVDLTGLGANSPDGAIEQMLTGLVVSQVYTFSMDVEVVGLLPVVTAGGGGITLSAGTPFTVGTDIWTPETGSFTAGSTSVLLKIMNAQAGQQITFIDNISVDGATTRSVTPEPNALGLLGIGLAGLLVIRHRRKA